MPAHLQCSSEQGHSAQPYGPITAPALLLTSVRHREEICALTSFSNTQFLDRLTEILYIYRFSFWNPWEETDASASSVFQDNVAVLQPFIPHSVHICSLNCSKKCIYYLPFDPQENKEKVESIIPVESYMLPSSPGRKLTS